MKADEFVEKALFILESRGEKVSNLMGNGSIYEDDLMIVRSGYNGLDLEITRKKMNVDGFPELAETSNPVTMVLEGKVIRHHGEHWHLMDHVDELCQAIEMERENSGLRR